MKLSRCWIIGFLLLLQGTRLSAEPVDTNLLPNGGFEFWVRPVPRNPPDAEPEPEVPTRWITSTDGSASILRSETPRSGPSALTVGGARGRATLSMSFLEVYAGATYRYGVWARGKGAVSISIHGIAMEGRQRIAHATGQAEEAWTHIGGEVTVPRHILDRVRIEVSAQAGTEIDDVHVSAWLDEPFDAEAVLRNKPERDGHTLFFEDFEGDDPSYTLAGTSKSALTDEGGGRFGRGLRLLRPGLAAFPLELGAMPREGTLEYWVTLDDFEKGTLIALMSPAHRQAILEMTSGNLIRVSAELADGRLGLAGNRTTSINQAMAGQWQHVAIDWDEHAIRLYLNGVLADVTYGRVRWHRTPNAIHAGSPLHWRCWNGIIDEVRLSSIRRYRAPVPSGFTPFPPMVTQLAQAAEASEAPEAGAEAREARKPYNARELREPRGALPLDDVEPTRPGKCETTPDATGAFVYEATSMRSLIHELPLGLSTNPNTGLVSANVPGIRAVDSYIYKDHRGGYWKLGEIPEGDYWIGLVRTCSSHVALYHNGRVVQFGRETEGLRATPGLRLTELQTDEPVRLREGDELAVLAPHGGVRPVRLVLRPTPPPPGRHYVAPHYDSHTRGPDTALAVVGHVIFHDAKGGVLPTLGQRDAGRNQVTTGPDALERAPDGRPAVRCEIFNPLPTAVEVEYAVSIRSHYRLPVGGATDRVRLEPHRRLVRLVPFDTLDDERAYSAELKLQVVEPRDESAWRKAMNWPELDWISFFPGMRQGIRWPKTFEDYDLRRIEFSEPVEARRRTVLLNGTPKDWEEALSSDWTGSWPTEEELEWEPSPRGTPVNPRHSERRARARRPTAHTLYMRRTFVLPDDADAQSCEILLSSTSHAAAMYVNGIQVGQVRGGNAPLLADATPAVRPGENELVIVAHNALAIMDPTYINPSSPAPNLQYTDAPGHFWEWGIGVGDVEMRLSPRIAVRELRVMPSTRARTLRTLFDVVNHRPREVEVTVRARVLEGSDPVLEVGEKTLRMKPEAVASLEFFKPWENARWWWPFDPHLYVMAVEVFDTATGERVDLLRERFGFRTSSIEGPHIMINDMPIRPRGSWLGYREDPNNFARSVDGSAGPDWTDERGMMGGTYITQLSNTGNRHAVESDPYWAAVETNAIRSLMLRVNNPSVMRWDMSNEWLQYLYGGNPRQAAQRFKHASDLVRAFDPTRWTTFGAEGDVHGLMDHFNFHYMQPYFQDAPGHPRMRGTSAYLPDGRFWRELHTEFTPGEGIPLCPHRKYVILRPGEKMFFDRESLWKVGNLMPPGTTFFAGENAVLWSDWDGASGPSLWLWKQEIDGRRDLGVSLINHFTHPGVKERAMPLQTFIVPEVQHHGFGGRTIERRYAVLQDFFRSCDMTFRWTLRGPDGQRLDGGEDRQRMSSGTTHRGVLRVTLPEVTERTLVTLVLELESDGVLVMAEERDLAVWPDTPVQAGPLARQVMLFEPESGVGSRESGVGSSRTAAALTTAGVAFEHVTDLSDSSDQTDPFNTLVILAEDALDDETRGATTALAGFVEAGGRVLVLRQTVAPTGLPFDITLDRQHWASQVYIRAGNHPVVAGWTDWDFHFWADDRAVVRGGYVKPATGAVVPILDSGEPRAGINWTGLLEMYRGEGLYLLCQLPVVAKWDEEPMAREVLARLLRYGGGEASFLQPTATLRLASSDQGPMVRRLDTIGVSYERVREFTNPGSDASSSDPVLVDAAFMRTRSPEEHAALARRLQAGATVVIAEAAPEDVDWLAALAERPLRISVPPYQSWDGRGMRSAWTPFTAGLSQVDLYWKRFDRAGNARRQAEDVNYVIETFQAYSVWIEGERVVESVWPGALVEVPVGRGLLVFDQRNLYTTHEDLVPRATRNLCALAMGMGARIEPPAPARSMPSRRKYQPIDLSAIVNRALRDESDTDGPEGWTGEGADADLRRFWTRNRRIGGVPFEFTEPPLAVALARPESPLGASLPSQVSIPIDTHIEGLCFLHTVADLASGASALYTLAYENGTRHTVRLEEGATIRSWENPGPLSGRRGTGSTLAWTGTTPRHPIVGLYRMEWTNPWPERQVKTLNVSLPAGHRGVPFLLAATAVLWDAPVVVEPKTPAPVEPADVTPAQAAQAREQVEAAAEALRAGDEELAQTRLKAALTLDPGSDDAHALRADLIERAGTEDEILSVYRAWIAAGAGIPRPFNRGGEILEAREDWRGALAMYTRSLEREWNQPPIITAKSRMEDRVK